MGRVVGRDVEVGVLVLRFGGVERRRGLRECGCDFFGVLVDDDIWLLRCSCILALLCLVRTSPMIYDL